MKTTLQRWGNSQGVRLPKSIIESMGMNIGAPVMVEVSGDHSQITITPVLESRPIRGGRTLQKQWRVRRPHTGASESGWFLKI